jgi:hypothetical protein
VKRDLSLVGLGLYSPAEAALLTRTPAPKIRRWLCGHAIGTRILIQLRVAKAFIDAGLSSEGIVRKDDLRTIFDRAPYLLRALAASANTLVGTPVASSIGCPN